jgi:tetratricopeptide (TPR) repeat protein
VEEFEVAKGGGVWVANGGMHESSSSSSIAAAAFECWEAGNLVRAVELYTSAIELCERSSWRLSTYFGELASVLAELGQTDRSIHFYQESLNVEIEQGDSEDPSGVALASYFLSNQLFKASRYQEALENLSAASRDTEIAWLLWMTESLAFFSLGMSSEALISAKKAILFAPSKEKKEEVMNDLVAILSSPKNGS